MARSLDLSVIAEGVEQEGRYELLNGEGCDEFQGFSLAKRVTAEEIPELVEQTQSAGVGPVGLGMVGIWLSSTYS